MSLDWTKEERLTLERGMAVHGVASKGCAALARIVYTVAKPRDERARGVQIRPAGDGRFLVPRRPDLVPYWKTHTYVETRAHAVDAITGPDGHPADTFLVEHWAYPAYILQNEVDPATVDPGIQHVDEP